MEPERELTNEPVDLTSMPPFVVITGMSGAGRTEATHVFEDMGYFCVDNLPASLIPNLVELSEGADAGTHYAVVCDMRNRTYFESLKNSIERIQAKGVSCSILFLDASDSMLVARYKSSRRRHPLCEDGTTIIDGIKKERELMYWLREHAEHVIDTSDMLPQRLRQTILGLYRQGEERHGLAVTVYSFGYKHGAPADADVVMDVRFLPNPFYEKSLRPLTGLDGPVRDYVMLRQETMEFQQRWHALLDTVMPGYVAEGKQMLAIAIGCTGGQHRSVVLAETTGDYLKAQGYRVSVAHRDLAKAGR